VEDSDAAVFRRAGSCWSILMPKCTLTLAELHQIGPNMLATGGARMRMALTFMHERGFVHCDVKSANVLVTDTGAWLLADFGSCTRVDELVTSTTEAFHPDVKLRHTPATCQYDWQLLFCMLLVEANKGDWKEVLMPPGCSRVSLELMQKAYTALDERTPAAGLRDLMQALNGLAFQF
jgi:serine/threonine protein kinase